MGIIHNEVIIIMIIGMKDHMTETTIITDNKENKEATITMIITIIITITIQTVTQIIGHIPIMTMYSNKDKGMDRTELGVKVLKTTIDR